MTIPSGLKYSEDHVWVSVDGDVARIGITDYAQEQLGDILFIDLPDAGEAVEAGCMFAEIETSETATELVSPVSGEIIAVHEALSDMPKEINDDAYDAWIIEVRLDDTEKLEELLSAEEYEDCCE